MLLRTETRKKESSSSTLPIVSSIESLLLQSGVDVQPYLPCPCTAGITHSARFVCSELVGIVAAYPLEAIGVGLLHLDNLVGIEFLRLALSTT